MKVRPAIRRWLTYSVLFESSMKLKTITAMLENIEILNSKDLIKPKPAIILK
ncbi:hypothetical protein [Caldicellulosiruptor bescii]|uniref:hypothetical protein n=1 Tax=Caldicellulosiruptor bescii TaxID=31899 RepID=UPI0020924A6E|nr:hypothetical protein [Caldicellulosiruptor bescii]